MASEVIAKTSGKTRIIQFHSRGRNPVKSLQFTQGDNYTRFDRNEIKELVAILRSWLRDTE